MEHVESVAEEFQFLNIRKDRGIFIAEGAKHEDREHDCTMCMSGNCKAKFKKGQ